jgi:hypothetical protein
MKRLLYLSRIFGVKNASRKHLFKNSLGSDTITEESLTYLCCRSSAARVSLLNVDEDYSANMESVMP